MSAIDRSDLDRIAERVAERLGFGTSKDSAETTREQHTEADASSTVNIASMIDHTLLEPEATPADVKELCSESLQHGFAAVCVDGSWVDLCTGLLAESQVKVATVAGFPHGSMTTAIKARQAAEAVGKGAQEIDMVAAIGRIVVGDWDYVEDDIAAVVRAAEGRVVKVILETAVLTPERIVQASAIAMEAGAHFVKTSTGLHPAGGATVDAVALMKAAVGDRLGIKAAGGIRDRGTALRLVAAGATRIGTSRGPDLVHSS